MKIKLTRTLTAAAALAAATAVLPISANPASAAPLAPGAGPAGTLSLTPSSGSSANNWTLAFDTPGGPQFCPGDGTAGYAIQSFIVPQGTDIASLTWSSGFPMGASGFSSALFLAGGSGDPYINNPGPAAVGETEGEVPTILPFNFAAAGYGPGDVPAGEYSVGIACTKAGVNERYWSVPVTITTPGGGPVGFDYSFGAHPVAPVIVGALTPGDQTLSGSFTHAASQPATTGYTVTAVPQGGGTTETETLAAGATTFTVDNLVNGTTYDVSIVATNGVDDSDPSNVVSGTPAVGAQPPVQNLQASNAAPETCAVTWTAPGSGSTPNDYTVTVTQAGSPISGSPFTVTSPLSLNLPGLTAGLTYVITVTANYTAPDFGTAATVTCIPVSNQVIIQQIDVERPVGNLILTQRCGIHGALPAYPAVDAFPGYPFSLGVEAADGTLPGGSPTLGSEGTGGIDPEFGSYPSPSPASYPTYCDLDLGTAQLVTGGDLAGYYAADGRLNQVSVLDTRDGDLGWILQGEMSDLSDGLTSSFDGNFVGWAPEVTAVTDTFAYTQVVAPGPWVAAGSGTTGVPAPADSGLGDGQILASADPGEGLGLAVLDARVLVLIPPTVPAGTYEGNLTLSFV